MSLYSVDSTATVPTAQLVHRAIQRSRAIPIIVAIASSRERVRLAPLPSRFKSPRSAAADESLVNASMLQPKPLRYMGVALRQRGPIRARSYPIPRYSTYQGDF